VSANLNVLCTICARGGSKGVVNKNIKSLCGKPLIAHSIEQLTAWNHRPKKIIVSTDSKEIADVAIKFGADVPFFRPDYLATDAAPKIPVIRHAWQETEKIYNEKYDLVIDIDPTAPVRKLSDIDNVIEVYKKKHAWNVFSVVKARKNPYFNMVELTGDGVAQISKKMVSSIARRQDAPAVYDMNASIYLYSREFLCRDDLVSHFTEKTYVYEMDDISAFDIDREIDFKFIEFLAKEGIWNARYE